MKNIFKKQLPLAKVFLKTLTIAFILLVVQNSKAQTTIVNYDFNSGDSYSTLTPILSQNITCSVSSTTTFNIGAGVATDSLAFTNNPVGGNSFGMLLAMDSSDYLTFQLGGSDLVHYSQYRFYLQLYFTTFSINTSFNIYYSTDNITYTASASAVPVNVGNYHEYVLDLSGAAALDNQPVIYFRIAAINNPGFILIDNFQIQANYPNPPASYPCTVNLSPASSTIFVGNNVLLTASGNADTYTWSPAVGLNSTTGATVTAQPLVTTTYSVTATGSGCTSNSASASITVNTSPPSSIGATGATGVIGATGADGALNAWSKTGTAGTVIGVNFLGTTDAKPLDFRTNNIQRVFISSGGNVGIGAGNPLSLLSVGASSQFRVNAAGDLSRIKNIPYSFPSVQGVAGSVLRNDGAGNLTWVVHTNGSSGSTGSGNGGGGNNNNPNAAWSLTGSTGTNPAINYIGTTDNVDFILRTNSVEALRVAATGNVGIGTSAPQAKLDVNGSAKIANELTVGGNITFAGNKIISYLPASAGLPAVFGFGMAPGYPIFDPCFPPWFSTITHNQFTGIIQSFSSFS